MTEHVTSGRPWLQGRCAIAAGTTGLVACTAGGLVAGVVAGLGWRRTRGGLVALLVTFGLAILTGALGCAFVPLGGVVGMMGVAGVGLVPWLNGKTQA